MISSFYDSIILFFMCHMKYLHDVYGCILYVVTSYYIFLSQVCATNFGEICLALSAAFEVGARSTVG